MLQTSPELNEIYRLFGICSHHCSNIEYRFCYFLMQKKLEHNKANLDAVKRAYKEAKGINDMVARLRDFDAQWAKVDLEIEKLYDLTMGQLINLLKNDYKLTEDQVDHFKDLKEKRNYLIHKFWGNYGKKMEQPEVLIKMKEELNEHLRYFQSVSSWLAQQIPGEGG